MFTLATAPFQGEQFVALLMGYCVSAVNRNEKNARLCAWNMKQVIGVRVVVSDQFGSRSHDRVLLPLRRPLMGCCVGLCYRPCVVQTPCLPEAGCGRSTTG